jgi:hypothetical protein
MLAPIELNEQSVGHGGQIVSVGQITTTIAASDR